MTNFTKTVLYIGVTSNLKARVWEHHHHKIEKAFTSKYNVEYIIYYEWFDTITDAIRREKQLKGLKREKKEAIIALKNHDWKFLNEEIYGHVYSLIY